MRKFILFLIVITAIGLSACNKDKNAANGFAQIRIINKTALPLKDVVIGDEYFGTIAPFQTSGYHNFNNLSAYVPPKLTFYDDKTLVEYFIGYCGTPPLPKPSFLQGRFSYIIVRDDTAPQGFEFNFKEE